MLNKSTLAFLAGVLAIGAIIGGVMLSNSNDAAPSADAKDGTPSGKFSASEEVEIKRLVRSYLMENPGIIFEMQTAYQDDIRKQEINVALTNARPNIDLLLDPSLGFEAGKDPANAKVAIVEFYDYHCGVCKQIAGIMQTLTRDDEDIKVIFREHPNLAPESTLAAEASLAAREQGKFMELHMAMMREPGRLTNARIDQIARQIGLDVDKLNRDRQLDKVSIAISQSTTLANQIQVRGTPGFFVIAMDGSYIDFYPGFHPVEITRMITEAKQSYGS